MRALYHGSSLNQLEGIRLRGIAPRRVTKTRDHWKHTVTSNKDAVYLTTVYAWHFAMHASDKEKGLILEVDRDALIPMYLCPDEDCLEQGTRGRSGTNLAPADWDMKKRTIFYREIARHNPHQADVSLDNLGTAGYYASVPWSAVTRFVEIDWSKLHPAMALMAADSSVSLMSYRFLRDRHAALTRWFFGDPVDPIEVSTWGLVQVGPELQAARNESVKQLTKFMSQRAGLRVRDARELD